MFIDKHLHKSNKEDIKVKILNGFLLCTVVVAHSYPPMTHRKDKDLRADI